MHHSENNARPQVRSQSGLSCKSSKRVQGGEPKLSSTPSDRGGTNPVGDFGDPGRSPYGCEDMAGNVWEWTASPWWEQDETPVVRGGSWGDHRDYAACAYRYYSFDHLNRNNSIGFRCART
ncbi:MAG: formylglycine-generating enzyme family protein [Bryobacteraceae bacterium]